MNTNLKRFLKIGIGTAAVFVVVLAASCASLQSSPKQVEASNPTVSYKYRNDDELVQTNQLAATFCDRYQSIPHTVRFTKDAGGDNVVVFECVSTSRSAMSNFNPNLTYTYRTDQELLDGSQNARTYCMNNGSPQVVSKIVRNSNGTRTVTFQCKAS
jgi:hypothetical protein